MALTIHATRFRTDQPAPPALVLGRLPERRGAACGDLDAVTGAEVQAIGDAVLVVEAALETDDLLILELTPDPVADALR